LLKYSRDSRKICYKSYNFELQGRHKLERPRLKMLVGTPAFQLKRVGNMEKANPLTPMLIIISHHFTKHFHTATNLKSRCAYKHLPCFIPILAEIQVCLTIFFILYTFICWNLGVPTNIFHASYPYLLISMCAYQHFHVLQTNLCLLRDLK